MQKTMRVLTFILAALCAAGAVAQTRIQEPNWRLAEAVEAASEVDLNANLAPLFSLARAGSSDELLSALLALEQREDWPEPARERVLQAFAQGLGEMPPGSVDHRVLNYLAAFEPRTLVPNPDYPLAGVPLYNVSASASGARAAWRRAGAARRAEILTSRGPEAWLDAWAGADAVERRGFVDSLERSSPGWLKAIGDAALQRSVEEHAAAPVAARAAILLDDREMLHGAMREVRGPELTEILRSAADALDAADRVALLESTLHDAPAESGALAMAILAPGLVHQAAVQDALFATLGDPGLGSSAALVLSRSGDESIRRRLSELAQTGQSVAARRAALAREAWQGDRPGNER
ncbi:MAG: hypothetical protein PVJ33_07070 [Lysobacterales bacterium]|jgi:hypothetical protein